MNKKQNDKQFKRGEVITKNDNYYISLNINYYDNNVTCIPMFPMNTVSIQNYDTVINFDNPKLENIQMTACVAHTQTAYCKDFYRTGISVDEKSMKIIQDKLIELFNITNR